MIEDAKIKDALLALAEAHKTRTIVLSTLINEVAALRETWEQEKGEQFSTGCAVEGFGKERRN